MVTAILDQGLDKKEDAMTYLEQWDIHTRPIFYPLSSLPAYRSLQDKKMKNNISYKISPFGINLPCGMDMTKEKVKFVSEKLLQFIDNTNRKGVNI